MWDCCNYLIVMSVDVLIIDISDIPIANFHIFFLYVQLYFIFWGRSEDHYTQVSKERPSNHTNSQRCRFNDDSRRNDVPTTLCMYWDVV